jgi:tRNA threonylcarbamoyladenosine biosynthesis protein TsaE
VRRSPPSRPPSSSASSERLSGGRLTWESGGPGDTAALGARLATILAPGDIVLLRGELGTGKTTLVRAVARALGVRGPVTSPTFTVAQRYEGHAPIAHVDAYRLTAPDDEDADLVRTALEDAIGLVEWPDAVIAVIPDARLELELRHLGGDRRLVLFDAREPDARSELVRLIADLRARHRHREPESGPRPG